MSHQSMLSSQETPTRKAAPRFTEDEKTALIALEGGSAPLAMAPVYDLVGSTASHMATRVENAFDSDATGYQPPVASLPVVRLLQPMTDSRNEADFDCQDDLWQGADLVEPSQLPTGTDADEDNRCAEDVEERKEVGKDDHLGGQDRGSKLKRETSVARKQEQARENEVESVVNINHLLGLLETIFKFLEFVLKAERQLEVALSSTLVFTGYAMKRAVTKPVKFGKSCWANWPHHGYCLDKLADVEEHVDSVTALAINGSMLYTFETAASIDKKVSAWPN
ncbi:hypothetical protein MRX96_034979 [Rhipicephalus microplus]